MDGTAELFLVGCGNSDMRSEQQVRTSDRLVL
jgi:hypothetical protein